MPMNYIPMSTPDIASARREMMRHIGVEYDSMLMGSSEEGEDKVIDQLEVDVDEHLDDWDFGDGPSIFDESANTIIKEVNVSNDTELLKWMKSHIKYQHFNKIQTPEEVLEKGAGDCHDQSLFEYVILKKLGYHPRILCMIEYTTWYQESGATHSIVYYKKDGKLYYFEHAWADNAGIHGPYNSVNEIKEFIYSKWPWGKRWKKLTISSGKVVPGDDLNKWYTRNFPKKEPAHFDRKAVNEGATLKVLNETYYRYTYDNKGIYDELKKAMPLDDWKKAKTDGTFGWLPVPSVYSTKGNYQSYFTTSGKTEFDDKVLPLVKTYLDDKKIDLQEFGKLDNIVYKDKYQVVVSLDSVNEGATDYNPAIGVRDAVTNQDHNDKEAFDPDKTKLPILGDKEESDDKKDENLLNDRMEDTPDDMENPIYEAVYPSQIPSYFNESAMKAKERNQLDDSEFGIPRLRKYPLNDEKHVRLAIQMFGHYKDPEDRKTLARNIFRRVAELNMDVKIKKGSAIYPYTPKKYLDEAASPIKIYGLETPMEDRTQKQINKEHENYLAVNTLQFYPEFAHHMKSLENLSFLDYFFPHITRGGFMAHLKGALDGAGLDSRIYDMLGFRPFYPVTQKTFAQRLGWYRPNLKPMDAQMTIIKRCAGHVNFFGNSTITPEDEDHTMYCIALYAIVGEILFNPQFTMERLEANHIGILTDWHQRVIDYYDQLQEFKPGDHGYFKCAQHLYDLLWNVNDNPMDKDAAARNIVSFVSQMASEKERVNNTMNEDADMTSKEECLGYMMMELELDDKDYLLPKQKKYAILNPGAVRLAMDVIGKIPADEKKEYVKNLNQKYKDFGCDFSISVDHPYAQYADQAIIDHMNRFLTEGETPVDKAAVSDAGSDLADAPWYLRNDVNGNVGQNLLQNKELGPNDKPMQNPDFTRSEAVL